MANTATAFRVPRADPARDAAGAGRPPRAGWYADPEQRAASRFFDGDVWTEHTRGPAPRSARAEAARARAAALGARSYGRFENRQAAAAVVVGAISIVLNPLFITSAVAVLLGMRGLTRSKASLAHQGRERALAGIVLAAVGMAVAATTTVALVAVVAPSMLRSQDAAEVQSVHAAVSQHVHDRGAGLASVDCPSPQPGSTIVCHVVTQRGDRLQLQVVVPTGDQAIQVLDQAPPVRVTPSHHRG